jgi:DNA-binding NtrC family response regulator
MPRTILLVDDQAANRYVFAHMLQYAGYDVVTASDAGQAALLFNARAFDLVLTDVQMPDVNGLFLVNYVHTRRPETPVLIMSGTDVAELAQSFTSAGLAEFIQKPFDGRTLNAAIERIFLTRAQQTKRPGLNDRSDIGCRRKKSSQTWHICGNCRDWPNSEFEEIYTSATDELELCNECRLLLSNANCS